MRIANAAMSLHQANRALRVEAGGAREPGIEHGVDGSHAAPTSH